jgi:hypothetical protein
MTVNRRDVLLKGGATAAALATTTAAQPAAAQAMQWHHTADIVVIGSGPPDCQPRSWPGSQLLGDDHGRGNRMSAAMRCSGGNLPLGGGNSVQKKYGIEFAGLVFRTHRLVGGAAEWFSGLSLQRHEIIRAFADNSAPTIEFLLAHGVVFVDRPPDRRGGSSVGNSVLRTLHCAPMDWPLIQTGAPANPANRATMSTGNGLMQPLDAAARRIGVEYLLEHKMTKVHRENGAGRVIGVTADNKGTMVNIRARKAVIIATGGSTGNVNFRRMFDPRLTEEYCGLAGMPWSNQDASGEIAAMAIGASLWGCTTRPRRPAPRSPSPGRSARSMAM